MQRAGLFERNDHDPRKARRVVDRVAVNYDARSYAKLNDAQKQACTHILMGLSKVELSEMAKNRASFPALTAWHHHQFKKINPASFPFLTDEQRKILKEDLLFMVSNDFLLRIRLDLAESKSSSAIKELVNDLHLAIGLMMALEDLDTDYAKKIIMHPNQFYQLTIEERQEVYERQLSTLLRGSEMYMKYDGFLGISRLIVHQAERLSSGGYTNKTIKIFNEFNQWRLYWVWGDNTLMSILKALHGAEAWDSMPFSRVEYGVGLPERTAGYISWILYYTRFGINLALLLKHTLPGPWMSAGEDGIREDQIPLNERFMTQWEFRKFALLNDLIWGTVNLLTFFWWTGPGMPGYVGSLATVALLIMDLSIATWALLEERSKAAKELLRYEDDFHHLEQDQYVNLLAGSVILDEAQKEAFFNLLARRESLNHEEREALLNFFARDRVFNEAQRAQFLHLIARNEDLKTSLLQFLSGAEVLNDEQMDRFHYLAARQNELATARDYFEFEQRHKDNKLVLNLVYAACILVAFLVVIAFGAVPGALPAFTLTAFALTGAIICFSANVAYSGCDRYLDLLKNSELQLSYREHIEEKTARFKALFQDKWEEYYQNVDEEGVDLINLFSQSEFQSELPPELKLLYLDIKALNQDLVYETESRNYQKLKLMHSIFVQLLIPSLLFAVLLFLPFGVGVPVFFLGMAAVLALNYTIETYDPKYKLRTYQLELMESLPDPQKALKGKIYLSNEGQYLVLDEHGTPQEGKFDLALLEEDDLEDKLQDADFLSAIMLVTSNAGHTVLPLSEFDEAAFEDFQLSFRPEVPRLGLP